MHQQTAKATSHSFNIFFFLKKAVHKTTVNFSQKAFVVQVSAQDFLCRLKLGFHKHSLGCGFISHNLSPLTAQWLSLTKYSVINVADKCKTCGESTLHASPTLSTAWRAEWKVHNLLQEPHFWLLIVYFIFIWGIYTHMHKYIHIHVYISYMYKNQKFDYNGCNYNGK